MYSYHRNEEKSPMILSALGSSMFPMASGLLITLGWGQIDEHCWPDMTSQVDHTMLSGVAKLSNLRCSTVCDMCVEQC